MIKSIVDTEARINEVLGERQKEVAEREAKLEEARAALTTAEKNIEAAIDSGDTKAYQKAKAEKADASDAIELREKRCALLKSEPLIDKHEYEKRCNAILSDLEAMTARQQAEVVKIIDSLKSIYDEAHENIIKGNEILERWQHEIYRDADRSRTSEGKPIRLPHEKMRFDNFDLITFIQNVFDDGYYKGFKGVSEDAKV